MYYIVDDSAPSYRLLRFKVLPASSSSSSLRRLTRAGSQQLVLAADGDGPHDAGIDDDRFVTTTTTERYYFAKRVGTFGPPTRTARALLENRGTLFSGGSSSRFLGDKNSSNFCPAFSIRFPIAILRVLLPNSIQTNDFIHRITIRSSVR